MPYDDYSNSGSSTNKNSLKSFDVYGENKFSYDDRKEQFLCGLPSIEGFTKCSIHKCQIETCNDSVCRASKYCEKHLCSYQIQENYCWMRCQEKSIGDSHFCEKHKCIMCDRQVFHEKVNKCQTHLTEMTCEFEGCRNVFPVDGSTTHCDREIIEMSRNFGRFDNVPDDVYKIVCYCEQHRCKHCGIYCIVSENTQYCRFHIQQDDPEFSVVETNRYCGLEWCGNIRQEDSLYCRKHTCKYKNCQNYRMEDDVELGDVIFSTKYCQNHHLLNELCLRNYQFDLSMLNIYTFIDFSDIKEDSERIKFIKNIKARADEYVNVSEIH
jgi:hypothetical protein